MAKTVTHWFALTDPPKRAGYYEFGYRLSSGHVEVMCFPFHWFNGESWCNEINATRMKPRKNPAPRDLATAYGDTAVWRGLAEQPK